MDKKIKLGLTTVNHRSCTCTMTRQRVQN